jgi:outer membrane lipoprotein-sorting protein
MFRRCRSELVFSVALAGVLAVGSARAGGQAGQLPTAAELVARHAKAMGGEAAYKAIKSFRARGTFSMPAQGISGAVEVVTARPNRLRMTIEIAGIGRVETGYDGKVAWQVDPITGPSVLTGRQATEMADDAWFDAALHGSEHVASIEVQGREMFAGRPAYRAKVVFKSGNEQTEYFDVESGLQVGYEAQRASPMGVTPVTAVMADFKTVQGVLMPTSLSQRTMGIEQSITIEAMEADTVPDSAFDLPAVIKALIKR